MYHASYRTLNVGSAVAYLIDNNIQKVISKYRLLSGSTACVYIHNVCVCVRVCVRACARTHVCTHACMYEWLYIFCGCVL